MSADQATALHLLCSAHYWLFDDEPPADVRALAEMGFAVVRLDRGGLRVEATAAGRRRVREMDAC